MPCALVELAGNVLLAFFEPFFDLPYALAVIADGIVLARYQKNGHFTWDLPIPRGGIRVLQKPYEVAHRADGEIKGTKFIGVIHAPDALVIRKPELFIIVRRLAEFLIIASEDEKIDEG